MKVCFCIIFLVFISCETKQEIVYFSKFQLKKPTISKADIDKIFAQKKYVISLSKLLVNKGFKKRKFINSFLINGFTIKNYTWTENTINHCAYFLPKDELLCVISFVGIDNDSIFVNHSIKNKKIFISLCKDERFIFNELNRSIDLNTLSN